MSILLTGATGFVGMSVLARLVEQTDGPEVYALVRAADHGAAADRLDDVCAQLWAETPPGWDRVHAFPGDLETPGLGLGAEQRAVLAASVDVVLHCAASVSFTLPLDEARAINVEGTRGVLDLAQTLPLLTRFVHVSTAYVAGAFAGTFGEGDRNIGQRPRNTYEQTKLEAEELVVASGVPWLIARPSIVVGEARSGWTASFNVLYAPLRAYARGLISPAQPLPADPDGLLDIVPVDTVADALVALALGTGEPGTTVHLVAGADAVTVAELIALAADTLGREPASLSAEAQVSGDDGVSTQYAPYFDVRTRFAADRSRALLAEAGVDPTPPLATYFAQLMSFAEEARWGRRRGTLQDARLRADAAQEQHVRA